MCQLTRRSDCVPRPPRFSFYSLFTPCPLSTFAGGAATDRREHHAPRSIPPPAWSAGKVALKKLTVPSMTPRTCALLDQAVHSCMRNLTEQGQSIEDLGTLGSPHFQLQQAPDWARTSA